MTTDLPKRLEIGRFVESSGVSDMRQYTGILCVSAMLALALLLPESWVRSVGAVFGIF